MDNIKLVKKVFKENFLRDLTDEEAKNFVDTLFNQTREDFSKIEGFTEEGFQKYMSANLEIAFSPNAVFAEIKMIVDKIGIEELEKSAKYKRLSEMNNAACLSLAMNKMFKEKWMIKGQDSPDIILAKVSSRSFKDNHLDAVYLEIMEIPEFARKELGGDIEPGIAEFIKEKKFIKRYEKAAHLLVHFNIQQMGLDLKKVSEMLRSFKDNPFHQVWSRINTDAQSQVMDISLLTPEFQQTKIDLVNDKEMFF